MSKFVFITGGVASSLGKGIAAASLASLLQARGYSVKVRKIDPYLNVDPGTMNPYQHGEVFITKDGVETDLDLGHYERFTNVDATRDDSISMGAIYKKLLAKERKGDYLSSTIQVIPHVTDLVKEFIKNGSEFYDFLICEVGGTVGDIEGLPCFEAIRQMGNEMSRGDVVYVHLTMVPYIKSSGELKTKPTQHSVKELRSLGIQPNVLLCRSERAISSQDILKIASFCNLSEDCVIPALDQDNIYKVPLAYCNAGLDYQVLRAFGVKNIKQLSQNNFWKKVEDVLMKREKTVDIAVIGKYVKLQDAYKSLQEAFEHAGFALHVKPNLVWIDAETINAENVSETLSKYSGIMVPGGFGKRGIESKILAIKYARENNVPFFGICLGMQLAVIEFMRSVVNIPNAGSRELHDNCEPVVDIMNQEVDDLGGTMRMGDYQCHLKSGTAAMKIYGDAVQDGAIFERHRHRYEVNNKYAELFEEHGLIISGSYVKQNLPEIVELDKHRWFIGVQFHPEFGSRPFSPHPLFVSFMKECCDM